LKIIIASYIGTICADGLGNILSRFFDSTAFFQKLINFIGYSGSVEQFTSITKILLFITIIVILTIWGDYRVDPSNSGPAFLRLGILILVAILSGGLILSTIIVFANGGSLIEGTASISDSFIRVYQESRLVKNLLDWHDVWFAAPGVIFVLISIFQKNKPAAP
jgi:hypothetical protein